MIQPNRPAPNQGSKGNRTTFAAFGIGIPLAVTILCLIHFGPVTNSKIKRYVSHPAECAEVLLFCCAVAGLGAKLVFSWTEWSAFRAPVLPPWNGKAVPPVEASRLNAGLDHLSERLQSTLLVRRVAAVLDFVTSRQSANELDDQLRSLADTDALLLEGSYSLTRFITWAIPILGFLGTVLGITQAISGVTPEVLEKSLSTVTDGLALAFDTTALGLALTMITMFISFIVERTEQSILESVDRFVDRQLAHRFERLGAEGGEYIGALRQNTQVLLRAVEQLVHQQVDIWQRAMKETNRLRTEATDTQAHQLTTALEKALDLSLDTHARRLSLLEDQAISRSAELVERVASLADVLQGTSQEHQAALAAVAQGLALRTQDLAELQEGEKHLLRLQETLNQNLAALAGVGEFDQAVHSLTAAIHLLTARASEVQASPRVNRSGRNPGAAA